MSTAFATMEKHQTPLDLPAVSCRNITKDFGTGEARVQALRGVTLEVRPGEVTLLVGPSGCGKTTLISIIAGILEPTGGTVSVLGTDLTSLPAPSAAENAAVPLLIAGRGRAGALARARALLAELGLGDRADALPSQMSG